MSRHPKLHLTAAALLLVAASTVAVRGLFGLGGGLGGRFLGRGGVVLQRSPSDCGLAAIATLAETRGVSLPPYDSLLSLYPPPPGGLSVLQLIEIGAEIGIEVKGWRLSAVALDSVALPAVIHLNDGHYVVLSARKEGSWIVGDPAVGRLAVSPDRLARAFSGVVLLPGPHPFASDEEPR